MLKPSVKAGENFCDVCGKNQADSFKACIHCCPHNELNFTEDWKGSDECGSWELAFECAACGKNFEFQRADILRNYKAVRR